MMNEYGNAQAFALLNWNRIAVTNQDPQSFDFPESCVDEIEEPVRQSPWQCTLEEVAEKLGVSRGQASLIEQQALRKCRAFCKTHGLRMEDLLAN